MAYKNLPRLRFNGFIGEWKEDKIGNKLYVKMGQSPHSENYTGDNKNNILVQGNADILNGKINPRIYTSEITKISKKNEIIMSVRAPVGELAINQFENVVIGRGVASLSGNKFDYYSLVNIKNKGLWKKSSSGSTFDSVNSSDIKLMTIKFPNKDEQQKIGDFYTKQDKLIELQTQKVDQLKKLKRGYLQKMFPQDDETVPRLRFSGFSGEWKEDRLGNYSHIIGGGTPSTSNDKYWNGNINWFSPIEIGKSKYVSNSTKKISDIGLKKSSAKILPEGSLLFTSRAGIGKTAILLKEACTNQGFQSIVPIDGRLDIEFLYAISYKLKNYGNKMGSGSTFTEVSGKTMSKMKLRLPNVDEQQKIGNFFAKLDRLIEQQSRKLYQLKEQKKAYLQKMFI